MQVTLKLVKIYEVDFMCGAIDRVGWFIGRAKKTMKDVSFSKTIRDACFILITHLITLQIRHAGRTFLSVFADRVDGSNPTAPVEKKS